MSDNVVIFPGETKLDLPPDRVLSAALGQMDKVLVLGYDTEGRDYFAASMCNKAELLWLVEKFKGVLMESDE